MKIISIQIVYRTLIESKKNSIQFTNSNTNKFRNEKIREKISRNIHASEQAVQGPARVYSLFQNLIPKVAL